MRTVLAETEQASTRVLLPRRPQKLKSWMKICLMTMMKTKRMRREAGNATPEKMKNKNS